MYYSNKNKMKTKNAVILTFTFSMGCEKAVKPEMKNTHATVEVKTLESNVPLGDDDDERILIKPRLFLSTGHVALGAEVRVYKDNFINSGVVDFSNALEIEVPEVGYYLLDVMYRGNRVLEDRVFVGREGLVKSAVILGNLGESI
jgi:hypothetical protein